MMRFVLLATCALVAGCVKPNQRAVVTDVSDSSVTVQQLLNTDSTTISAVAIETCGLYGRKALAMNVQCVDNSRVCTAWSHLYACVPEAD